MASFSEAALIKKLSELNASQQSIQTLSLWLIHHRKHHQPIVKVWYKELLKAADKRKITFIYLANDVIQNSKKKGPEYGKEFGTVLLKAMEHMVSLESMDAKSRNSLERVIKIWEDRGVYNNKQITAFKNAIGGKERTKYLELVTENGDSKKRPAEDEDQEVKKAKNMKETYSPEFADVQRERTKSESEMDVDAVKELHVTLSPKTPAGDPPEPEEIIKALMDLESSASSDVAVREAIAHLPPEVTDAKLINSLTDRSSAERLAQQVNAAVKLLNDYNARLADELEDRKRVTIMLRDFTHSQCELLSQAKDRLEEYQEKLQKVHQVRQEVRSHIQNLPDISQLPDVTGGLAPLPSAGDLFSFHT